MKNEQKKNTQCLIWAFLLLLIPAVGASAATELQYVYLTPSEDGSQTGVIVALNGTEPESASLDYGTGTVKASEISGNHLVFLVPGSGVTEKNLKSLTIEKNSDKETIRLTSFFQAAGTEKLDPTEEISDSGIASGRSRAAGGITEAQEATAEAYTAESSSEIISTTGSSLCSGRNFSFPLRHGPQHCSGAGPGPRRKRGRGKPYLERRPL